MTEQTIFLSIFLIATTWFVYNLYKGRVMTRIGFINKNQNSHAFWFNIVFNVLILCAILFLAFNN